MIFKFVCSSLVLDKFSYLTLFESLECFCVVIIRIYPILPQVTKVVIQSTGMRRQLVLWVVIMIAEQWIHWNIREIFLQEVCHIPDVFQH